MSRRCSGEWAVTLMSVADAAMLKRFNTEGTEVGCTEDTERKTE